MSMYTSCRAGRSFLFLDEKKRTKEKSWQNNAATRHPWAPSLFCRANAPEQDILVRQINLYWKPID